MAKKTLNFWLIIIPLVFVFLRLPSLFEPFTYGDEGIYLTLGLAIRKGLVLYKQIHDNKPPLLYILAAAAGNFSFYRGLLFLSSGAAVFLFFKFSQLLFKNKNSQIFATLLFVILTSLHTFEGNVGNAENFMILPTLAGFYLYLKAKNPWHYFFAGVFFSLAVLFKVPAAFDFLALLFFILLNLKFKKDSSLITNYLLLFFGFLLPILATFVYFFCRGALKDYLVAAFLQNIPYLSSWAPDKATKVVVSSGFFYSFINRSLVLAAVLGLLFYYRQRLNFSLKLIISWFAFSLFAALLSTRPYPHYLLQVIPSLSLAGGLLFEKEKKFVFPLLAAVFGFFFFYFKFWHYPNFSYYANFYQFALGKKSKEEYLKYFGNHVAPLYQTAQFIKLQTSPSEKIFIWGNEPSIYSLSQRLPVGKYTVAYHILDFKGQQKTLKALKETKPPFIIVTQPPVSGFPELFSFLKSNYFPFKNFDNFVIYQPLPQKPS